MSIEQLLPPSPEFLSSYNEITQIGFGFAKNTNIVFSGLVRNVGDVLSHNVKFFLESNIYKNIYIVLYENDSTDNTKNILQDLKQQYPDNFFYISETLNLPHLPLSKSDSRTIPLANYRNICQDFIKQQLYDKIDFISVVDFDFIDISISGILNTLGWFQAYDDILAISGNSFQYKHIIDPQKKNMWNYDSWAYRGTWWIDKQKEPSGYDPMLWFGFWIPPIGSPLIRTNSSFGGLTTYRKSIYFNAKYEGYDCEHVCFHKNLNTANNNFAVFLNPSQILLFP